MTTSEGPVPNLPDVSADSTGGEVGFGRFSLHKAQRWLLVDGKPAKLSPRAFDVLAALIDNGERMVSKSELLDIVWPRQVVEDGNIHVHVSALRKLLGPDVIATVPGRGYRFVHPLKPARGVARPAAEPAGRAGNLQLSLPPLFGREEDLALLGSLLRAHRLVTLVGMGGIGKTCLALAAAHAQREAWPDGVWFVDLAPVDDPAQLPAAVARSLGLALPANRAPTEELALALRHRAMLLLLDNAEQVCEATAALVSTLLDGSPRLAIVVTSRQALHLRAEQRFNVRPLGVPEDVLASDDPRSFGAMALFEARASAADPRFRLGDRNAAAVADVCRHVDGVPLAIELAAARVQVLGIEGLRAGLLQSLRVLGPGDARHSPRHRTLRATFDWTHTLLPRVERELFRRLAVFVGGFTLNLAQRVAIDPQEATGVDATGDMLDKWDVVDALDALIDKSLVVADGADPPRYRLLEVTRAYALEKLSEAAESQALFERHARAVWQLFADAEVAKNEQIRDALTMSEFLQLLAPELDNLRAARTWSRGPSGNRTLAIGLAASSSEALRMLGLSTEAMLAMQPFRDEIDEHVAPETAELFWTGLCALGTHGRLPSSEMLTLIEKAELLYRRFGNPRRVHLGLYRKGFALMHLRRCEEGQLVTREMERLEAPDWPAKAVAQRLNLQAGLDGMMGRFEASIEAFTRAAGLLRFERGEDDFVLNTLVNLCLSVLCTQRHDEALAVARDVLGRQPSPVVRNSANRVLLTALTFLGRLDEASAVSHQAMRDWRSDDLLPYMLSVFAWLACQQGRVADAVRLDGAGQMQVLRKALPDSPVSDRARALLFGALKDCHCTDEEIARWRFEGEQAKEDALVAWCLGT